MENEILKAISGLGHKLDKFEEKIEKRFENIKKM